MEAEERVHLSRMSASNRENGWHSAYQMPDGRVAIEWVEYRDPAPYDHATTLVVQAVHVERLMESLAASGDKRPAPEVLATTFDSYWSAKSYFEAFGIPHNKQVNFNP